MNIEVLKIGTAILFSFGWVKGLINAGTKKDWSELWVSLFVTALLFMPVVLLLAWVVPS